MDIQRFNGISLDALAPSKVITLPFSRDSNPGGIAFDGGFFYITVPQERVVHKLNKSFAIADSVQVDKPYTVICYDTKDKVFWAAVDEQGDVVYKLNRHLKCIGRLEIKIDRGPIQGLTIQGLTYNCVKNVLLAAYADSVVEISKENGHACILHSCDARSYAGAMSMAPYYGVAWQDVSRGCKVIIYTSKGQVARSFCIPGKYTVEDILFYPCGTADRFAFDIFVLALGECDVPVVLCYTLVDCAIAPDRCNYVLCKKHNDDKKTCKHPCCKLLESVALIEAAMAHILNAEGEKLQKAAKDAVNIGELIEVNNSVSKTIADAAHLEYMLVKKLEAIEKICTNMKHPVLCEKEE